MEPEIKVTRINNCWHARLIKDGKVLDEMACEYQQDIGWICREMLRWHSKLGCNSQYADKARHRQFYKPGRERILFGKVWYKGELDNNKLKNKK